MARSTALKSRTLQRFETYWPKEPVRRLVDQLYWRAKNRYIAMRGAAEAGKSTTLNLLLGMPMLEASDGQTTGCITEIRPVTGDDVQSRVHLVSAAQLERRLAELKGRVSADEYGDYQRAATEAGQLLQARNVVLGETLTSDEWKAAGFSAVMGQGKMHEVVIDRITLPVAVPPEHPLRWAAEAGVSILDLPGDAQGEIFNGILLAEAMASYPPSASVRVWRADDANRPDAEPGELLVITFLDAAAATPLGGYLKSIRGTMQDYTGRPFVISAAMDEPTGIDLGLSTTKEAAEERLRAWRDWLSQPDRAGDQAYERLLRGVEQSLAHSGGGSGALNDELKRQLAASPDPTVESDEVKQLAQQVVAGLRDLLADLAKPLTPAEELHRKMLAEQEARQARRSQIRQSAQSHVYGEFGSSPWQYLADVIDAGLTAADRPGLIGQLAALVSEHADAAQRDACATLGVPASTAPLAEIAAPLIDGLAELIADHEQTAEDLPTWVDVARVRWELSNLLAALLIEADPKPAEDIRADEVDIGHRSERAEHKDDYPLKAGVLNECIKWAGSLS